MLGKVVCGLFGAFAVILTIVSWRGDSPILSLAIIVGSVVIVAIGMALLMRGLKVNTSPLYLAVVIAGMTGAISIGMSSVPLAIILPPVSIMIPTLLLKVRIGQSAIETALYVFAPSTVGIMLATRPQLESWKPAPALMAVLLQLVLLMVVLVYRRAAFPPKGAMPRPHSVTPGLMVIGIAAVFAFFYSTISIMAQDDSLFSRTRAGADSWRWWPAAVGCLALGAAVVFRRRQSDVLWPAATASTVLTVCWIAFLALTFNPSVGASLSYTLVSLGAALGMGLLSAESVWVTAILQDRRPGLSGWLLGACAGLAVAASIAWLTLSAIWVGLYPGRLGSSLGASGIAIAGGYAVALVCARVSSRKLKGPVVTEDPPAQVLTQDQLLYMFFSFLAIAIPAITFTESGGQISTSLEQPLTYLAAPFYSFFAFTLRNNWDHWHRQQIRIPDLHDKTGYPANPDQWLRLLRRHMWFQVAATVLITCAAVIPLIVLILSATVFEVVRSIHPSESSGP